MVTNSNAKFKKIVLANIDGSYTVTDVPAGNDYRITFSYVGYTTRVVEKIKIGQGSELLFNASLEPAVSSSETVVVVAYSTQKKANLTGAVDQVSGKVFENRSLPNITQGLQGYIPNLNLVMGDGKPIQSPAYNIRGNTSIGQGGNALVLIDGVEGNPSLLNPNDVANVTVLKDAASAAIYGARGAFGVVLITTKNPAKGKTGITTANFRSEATSSCSGLCDQRLHLWQNIQRCMTPGTTTRNSRKT